MDMEHWFKDTDRGSWSTTRKTCSSIWPARNSTCTGRGWNPSSCSKKLGWD